MPRSYFWLALGWIGYGAIHSILASIKCKEFFEQKTPFIARHYRLLYIVIAIITLAIMAFLFWETPRLPLWNPTFIAQIPGILLIIFGCIIMGISIRKYFSTVKNMDDLIYDNTIPVLFEKGIHQYVRHPLYLGTFLVIWGFFLIFPYGSLLITNVIITLYTLLGIVYEEKKLSLVFGEKYHRYIQKVPMIIPKLRKPVRVAPNSNKPAAS
ncbi:MAG: methyltransferase family protein [Chitinophagaceae bacterium]